MTTCVRVYANGERRVDHFEKEEDVNEWQRYNVRYRPGCGAFVDGKCIHRGYLTAPQVTQLEQELSDDGS